MRITLRTGSNDEQLESFRPTKRLDWEMVTSGEWSQSPFHGGRIVYEVAQAAPDTWLLQACEWSDEEADWDDPTDYARIVAVLESAPAGLTAAAAARHLYEAWCAAGEAKVITETYLDGLLEETTTTDDSDSESLDDLPDVEAWVRRQAQNDSIVLTEVYCIRVILDWMMDKSQEEREAQL